MAAHFTWYCRHVMVDLFVPLANQYGRVAELVREYRGLDGYGGAVHIIENGNEDTGNEDNAYPLEDKQTITKNARMTIIKLGMEMKCLKSIYSTSTNLQEKWSQLKDVAFDGVIPDNLEGVVVENGHITELCIDQPSLNELPDLSPLVNLTKLKVRYNPRLKEIPGLSQLVNLTHIEVSVAGLTELPDLSKLVNLTDLDVSSNKLYKLPNLADLRGGFLWGS